MNMKPKTLVISEFDPMIDRRWLLELLDRSAPVRRYNPTAPDIRETARWICNEIRLRVKEYAQLFDDGNPNTENL